MSDQTQTATCMKKFALCPETIMVPPPQRVVLAQDHQHRVKLVSVCHHDKGLVRYEVNCANNIQFSSPASYGNLQQACDEFNRLTERA